LDSDSTTRQKKSTNKGIELDWKKAGAFPNHSCPALKISASMWVALCEYLEVRRPAMNKAESKRNPKIIASVSERTHLNLLNNGSQQNGYYNPKSVKKISNSIV